MRTTRTSLVTALLTLSICVSVASAGAPIGPPVAILGEGQWSVGGEFAHEQMDMEAYGKVTDQSIPFFWTQQFEIEDLTSNMAFGNIAYGVTDNWDIFLRVGAADAADDITIPPADTGATEQQDSFDGGYGLAWGIGTRATFGRWGPWSFGGTLQATWFKPGDSDYTITDPFQPDQTWSGDVELDYWQTQVSLAAAYDAEGLRLWAGPFLQFIAGDMDFDGQITVAGISSEFTWASDLNESSQIGGFAGASIDLGEEWSLWGEGQITGDSWLIGVGLVFIPENYDL